MHEASGAARSEGRTRPGGPSGDGFLWNSWLWIAWLLGPVAFAIRTMSGVAGWETLFFAMLSPLLVPVLGLLGALPRFVLRRRGHRTIPAAVAAAMTASAWGLVLVLFSMRGATDGASIDSVLLQFFPGASQRAELLVGQISLAVMLVAYLVGVVCAATVRPSRRPRAADLATLAALVLVPTLIGTGAFALDRAAMRGERDFGGATEAETAHLSADAQRERQEAQWDEAQAALTPLRSAIADDGWRLARGMGVEEDGDGIEPRSYRVVTFWETEVDGDPESAAQRVRELAETGGWAMRDRGSHVYTSREDEPGVVVEDDTGVVESVRYDFEDEHGTALTMWSVAPETEDGAGSGSGDGGGAAEDSDRSAGAEGEGEAAAPGRTVLRLSSSSGPYWQSRGEPYDWRGELPDGQRERMEREMTRSYAGDEWPELLVAQSRLRW